MHDPHPIVTVPGIMLICMLNGSQLKRTHFYTLAHIAGVALYSSAKRLCRISCVETAHETSCTVVLDVELVVVVGAGEVGKEWEEKETRLHSPLLSLVVTVVTASILLRLSTEQCSQTKEMKELLLSSFLYPCLCPQTSVFIWILYNHRLEEYSYQVKWGMSWNGDIFDWIVLSA